MLGISGPGQAWDKGDLGVVGDVDGRGDGAPEGRIKSVVAVGVAVAAVPEVVVLDVEVDWAEILETNKRAKATTLSILGFTMVSVCVCEVVVVVVCTGEE